MFITNQRPGFVMNEKDNYTIHLQFHVKAIKFLMVGIVIIVTGIFVSSLLLNQNHTAISQRQQPQEQPLVAKDISLDIDNVIFSHHMASVDGIQLHYVIGGNGDPIVLIHGWPQTWYEWRHVQWAQWGLARL